MQAVERLENLIREKFLTVIPQKCIPTAIYTLLLDCIFLKMIFLDYLIFSWIS